MALENVCLIIKMYGFQICNKFYVRELGFHSLTLKEAGSYRFNLKQLCYNISEKDWNIANLDKFKIHGLSIRPLYREIVYDLCALESIIGNLYARSIKEDRHSVAYNAGSVEMDLLNRLKIPCINIQLFGCPKFENLPETTVTDCGFHLMKQACIRCPQKETVAYGEWIIRMTCD